MSETAPDAVQLFIDTWKAAFSKILTQLGAADIAISEADGSALEAEKLDKETTIQVNFSGGECLKGHLEWTCAKTAALQCAQLLMSEAIDAASEFADTHKDGFQEFMRQVSGEVAVAWKQHNGAPAEITFQAESADTFASKHHIAVALDCDKAKGLLLRMDLDAELLASLTMTTPEAVEASDAGEAVSDAAVHGIPSNLSLILDVQLDATIRFGEREMLLRDVFGLLPGAVVELNQLVNEPAELLVAGRLIAKGEVVVVDGNFGLRVSEVVSPAQRAAVLSL